MTIAESLSASYTKALLHNPKGAVFENISAALNEVPVVSRERFIASDRQCIKNGGACTLALLQRDELRAALIAVMPFVAGYVKEHIGEGSISYDNALAVIGRTK